MARLVRKVPLRKKTVKKVVKAAKAVRRAVRPADGLNSDDVSFLFDRLQAEERSEAVWKEMTAAGSDEGDAWHAVGDHLAARQQAREDHQRRWKFFGVVAARRLRAGRAPCFIIPHALRHPRPPDRPALRRRPRGGHRAGPGGRPRGSRRDRRRAGRLGEVFGPGGGEPRLRPLRFGPAPVPRRRVASRAGGGPGRGRPPSRCRRGRRGGPRLRQVHGAAPAADGGLLGDARGGGGRRPSRRHPLPGGTRPMPVLRRRFVPVRPLPRSSTASRHGGGAARCLPWGPTGRHHPKTAPRVPQGAGQGPWSESVAPAPRPSAAASRPTWPTWPRAWPRCSPLELARVTEGNARELPPPGLISSAG